MAYVASNARNGDGQPTVWRTEDYDYQVIVRHDWHVIVAQRDRSDNTWTTHDVSSTVIGLMDVEDSHDAMTMVVDGDGYIHVAGNMHQEGLRHIRSTNPHDITAWVEEGDLKAAWSGTYTNLVPNPDVWTNTTGWAAVDGTKYPISRVTNKGYELEPGVVQDATTSLATTRGGTLDNVLGAAKLAPIDIVGGELVFASVSMATSRNSGRGRVSLEFRQGGSVLSTSVGPLASYVTGTMGAGLRVLHGDMAPALADNVVVTYELLGSNNGVVANNGDLCWFTAALVTQEIPPWRPERADTLSKYWYFSPNLKVWPRPTDEGERIYHDRWTGAANNSPSETRRFLKPGKTGADVGTYAKFDSFSDGTLAFSCDQSDEAGVIGRDWVIATKAPGGAWTVREIMYAPTDNFEEPNITTTDTVPDRSYGYGMYVDSFDVIHFLGVWRVVEGDASSMSETFYIRSSDKGATWTNVWGDPVTIPVTYRRILDDEGAAVRVSGVPVGGTTGGIMEVDRHGRPWFIVNHASHGVKMIHFNGISWEWFDVPSNYTAPPSISFLNDDLWLWGRRNTGGNKNMLTGSNWNRGTTDTIVIGPVNYGTPDGNFRFESGATYQPAPPHGSGSTPEQRVTLLGVPNRDEPRIFEIGTGPRYWIVERPEP